MINDLHIHSIASGHAFSTTKEIIDYSRKIGLKAIAITDHGPSMKGAPHVEYFDTIYRIPDFVDGLRVFKGCEANIIDDSGNLDLPQHTLEKLDIVIVGLHKLTPYNSENSIEKNTSAIINCITKNKVHIIAHPFRLDFQVDIEEVVSKAITNNVLLELNLSLLQTYRKSSVLISKVKDMIKLVDIKGGKIVINSDAHYINEIGDDSILKEFGIKSPESIIFGRNGIREIENFIQSSRNS